MNALIPVWIIGAPFVALVVLSMSFKNANAIGSDRSSLSDRSSPGFAPRGTPESPIPPRLDH